MVEILFESCDIECSICYDEFSKAGMCDHTSMKRYFAGNVCKILQDKAFSVYQIESKVHGNRMQFVFSLKTTKQWIRVFSETIRKTGIRRKFKLRKYRKCNSMKVLQLRCYHGRTGRN